MTEIESTDTSLTVSRTFHAPRERVWAALTDPAQVDRWWGPNGFTTTTDEMAARPGGEWRFEMRGPDGEVYPNLVVYDEVEAPGHLVYTHGSPDDPEQFHVTITLDAVGEGETVLSMEMRFPSAGALDDALDYGADDGAEQTMARLADHLAGN